MTDLAARVLVVDDDTELCELLEEYLTEEGFQVETVHDGAQGLDRATSGEHGLVVLDVMLPGLNGFELLQRLRARSPVPVVMLTARGQDVDRIVGIEMGADDYLAKPFEPRELLLRIESILRRQGPNVSTASEISMGACTFHVERGELRRDGVTVRLTTRERELLRLFASRPGKTITRAELSGHGADGGARAVDVQINRLRRKIEADPATPVYLQTVRGSGYILYTD